MTMSVAVRMLDDAAGLLGRAANRLDAGSGRSARHLLAAAGRRIDEVIATPNVLGTPSGDGRVVLQSALARVRSAHSSIATGAVDDAARAIGTSRFLVDLQLPYGAVNALA